MKATRMLTPTLLAAGCALGLAACGSGGGATGATSTVTTGAGAQANGGQGGSTAQSGAPGNGRDRGAPGANGLIAAVSGTTLQVQSRTAQVAVLVKGTTRITQQVAASAAALRTGVCVVAMPARTQPGASGAPTGADGGATPGQAPTQASTVAAATVAITAPTNGSCGAARGVGGPGGQGMPTGGSTMAPPAGDGLPTGDSTGGPRGGGFGGFGGFGGAVGTVASLGSGSFTVTVADRPVTGGATSAPTSVTVTYTDSTAFTTTRAATASAIKVGECARAVGSMDDTGTVTATTLALSAAVDGACSEGFGGRRG